MSASNNTASFFENGTTQQFEYCFKLYPQVLRLKAEKRCKKPQDLIRLDEWYQNELPKLISARGKDAHMVYDELVQTMKWKQSRGKFYPQLSYLVKVNTPRAVMQETKKAFRKLPNLEQAITALSNLKGVGTTMASALLAAAAPDKAPFMADECLMAIPEIEGIDYTTKEYLNFVQHIQATVTRLNAQAGGETAVWSAHRVELALWAHYVANDLSPEILDEMPGPGAGGGANTNGSTGNGATAEDTNDADDESLGAAGRGTATESETENENTNPPPAAAGSGAIVATGVLQDGDSNFVSNDSTSQEEPPIIDENTTQTTATTSTDDGEVGTTPPPSDSESNLEVPTKANINKVTSADAVVADATEVPATVLANSSNGNSSNNKEEAVTVVGNGNGTLLVSGVGVAGAAVVGDSLDGENSSCLRALSTNDDEEDEDEEELEEERNVDESSNSNSHGHKSVTPIINMNDGTNNTNTNNTDNDSTLSSAGIGVNASSCAQKRSLVCIGDGAGDGGIDDANSSQPEMKKVRSD